MPSTSKKQQKYFGMVKALKDGKLDTNKLDAEFANKIKKTAAKMSTADVKDFAETKHEGLPEKVKPKKENKIARFDDFEINEAVEILRNIRKSFMSEAEKNRMKNARKIAQEYADKYHTYNRARKEFLQNVVNSPYRVNNISNNFIEEFWSELKKIFPS